MATILSQEEEKMFEGQPRGFPFGDFDVADVMLPDGDDMGIPSDDEEEDVAIETESGFGNMVGTLCTRVCRKRDMLCQSIDGSRLPEHDDFKSEELWEL